MTTSPGTIELAAAELAGLRRLYDRGLHLQAYRQAERLGPMKAWRGTTARVLAGRLAINLGAPRLQRWLHIKAWRADPADAPACYYRTFSLLDSRGPLATWRFMQRHETLFPPEHEYHSDWLALHARVAGPSYIRALVIPVTCEAAAPEDSEPSPEVH